MAKNGNLTAAKKAKNDEFYTQKADIEAELSHYAEHFRGKVVYCNCDDPVESEFWKFFVRVFKDWGLKKLIATHYEPNEQNFSYKIEAMPDENGEFKIDSKPVETPLPCNGDFRSAACIELLEEADIVVTNPPFSLFREYVAQLMEYGKKFLIIGSMNAITYKEIFPLLKGNDIWLGYNHPKQFRQPDGAMKSFGNIMWYTNLEHQKRHQFLDLRGNKYYGNENMYPRYANYDAIECSKVSDIPEDYFEYIGVPITFLDKYCPDQFDIIGLSRQLGRPMSEIAEKGTYEQGGIRFYLALDDSSMVAPPHNCSTDACTTGLSSNGVEISEALRQDRDSSCEIAISKIGENFVILSQNNVDLKALAKQYAADGLVYYSGIMGVPITFLDKYCPEQFDILGITLGNTVDYEMTAVYETAVQHNKDGSTQGGSKVNTRAAIRVEDEPKDMVYYTADNVEGYLLSVYPRVLIRRKVLHNG